jgi:hypothetical protein
MLLHPANAQTTTPPKDKAYYLAKSKEQKIVAWVMLGGGTAMLVGGIIGFNKNFTLDGGGEAEILVAVVGGACVIGSPFMFMSAAKNKNKAEAMTGVFLTPAPKIAVDQKEKSMPSVGIMIRF